MILFFSLLAVALAFMLAYFRTPAYLWAVTGFVLMSVWTGMDESHRLTQGLMWMAYFIVMPPLTFQPLRRKLLSQRLFELFKKITPSMSSSEQEALEAGSVWWDGELFAGRPNWKRWLKNDPPALTDEERQFIDGPVEELCAMLDDWHITREAHDLPERAWDYIKHNGFLSIIIPKEYGGLGFSAVAHSTIVMKISSRSVSAAVTVMVPNSLGPAELLLQYGTDDQRNYYLPRLAKGKEIPCFALTGPEAGSDASAMPDTGIVCYGDYQEQKDVLGIRLNWEKRYITLGPVATLLGLAFHMYDPDHLLGEQEDIGITLALIPTTLKGIDIGNRHNPMGIAFMNGPNRGRDVFIPLDMIIGGQARVGQGWRMLMECLATGRSISLPALSTGVCKFASRATGAYSRIRQQFNLPIGKFEGVEEALSRIAGHTYQMDAVRNITANAIDHGHSPSVLSAIAKYHLTERGRSVINDAMDIQAGSAISLGPRNLLARIYQSLPISITVEGANILTRSMIIFGQGAMRSHPNILAILNTVRSSNKTQAAKEFDRVFFKQIRYYLGHVTRALWTGLTAARFIRTPVKGIEAYYYRQLSRMSTAFALLSDSYMVALGAQLKRREKVSGRLADILSELYIASCVLKHYQNQGAHPQDLPLLQWACDTSLYTIQTRINELLHNFPIRPLGWLLKRLIFPLGRSYAPAPDKLGGDVAGMLLEPCPPRYRLTQDIYIPHCPDEPLGRIESALSRVIAAEPVESTVRQAIKQGLLQAIPASTLIERATVQRIITPEQANMIRAAQAARRDVIMVDEFTADLSQAITPRQDEQTKPGPTDPTPDNEVRTP